MGCCDSGGNGGDTTYRWNPYMENQWAGGVDGNTGLLGYANRELFGEGSGYKPYGEQVQTGWDSKRGKPIYEWREKDRTANFNDTQTGAIDAAGNLLNDGTRLGQAGREQSRKTVEGEYLGGYNPYGTSTPLDRQGAENPYYTQTNQYEGMSPQFNQMLDKGMGDIVSKYQLGTAADTAKMFANSRSFGGSAHQEAVDRNQKGLGDTLSNYASGMYNQQWDRSGQLQENKLNRTSDYYDRFLNRDLQSQQYNQGLNTGTWNQERGRMVGATGGAMGNDMNALNLYQGVYGMGALDQNQRQRDMDIDYQDFQDQNNWNRNNISQYANWLSQAQGGIGGQVSMYGGGPSGMQQALGAGLMGYGMFRS